MTAMNLLRPSSLDSDLKGDLTSFLRAVDLDKLVESSQQKSSLQKASDGSGKV